jgi:hypothetical protein
MWLPLDGFCPWKIKLKGENSSATLHTFLSAWLKVNMSGLSLKSSNICSELEGLRLVLLQEVS